MELKIKHDGELSVIELFGSINSGNAQEFEAALAGEPSGADGMLIDADGLEFISSAGLRVLLSAKKRCKAKTFRIINVSNDVRMFLTSPVFPKSWTSPVPCGS